MTGGLILLLLLSVLSGCSARPEEINQAPELSPVGSGLAPPTLVLSGGPDPADQIHPHSSIWHDQSADLFKDRRARRVGDVLTVNISIKDRASLDNRSERSREGSRTLGIGVGHSVGWRGWSSEGTASLDGEVESESEHQGKGAVARSEDIELQLAAVVTGVLPNGNLVIQGTQEIRVNYELRVLEVSGVVDLRDIQPNNTISYDRIAEARMTYGGRGRIMEVQQPSIGYQLIDILSPF